MLNNPKLFYCWQGRFSNLDCTTFRKEKTLTSYLSALDFWNIQFEISSLMNWMFSLFQTWILQATAKLRLYSFGLQQAEKSSSNYVLTIAGWMHLYRRIFLFAWLGLPKVSQAAAGKNLWKDPRKYHVRQWAGYSKHLVQRDSG